MDTTREELRKAFEENRELFIAFGDRYRQEIILLLGEEKALTVKQLAEKLELSRPTTSHHIKILKNAGLLGERKEGTKTYYYPTLRQAVANVKSLIDASDHILTKEGM